MKDRFQKGRPRTRQVLAAVVIIAVFFIANIDTYIRQGLDGVERDIHMPLYVKWLQFTARHYEYARLAKEITVGCKGDEKKALAILDWTRRNLKDMPAGMPVMDDHILYIIIRGYAVPEQFQDVFVTLCSYAGIPAFWRRSYDNTGKVRYNLSLVRLGSRWCVFDAYRGVYFRNTSGGIASAEDIIADRSLVRGDAIDSIQVGGAPYREFFYNIKPVKKPSISRPEKQMILPRILFETKKALRLEREDEDTAGK